MTRCNWPSRHVFRLSFKHRGSNVLSCLMRRDSACTRVRNRKICVRVYTAQEEKSAPAKATLREHYGEELSIKWQQPVAPNDFLKLAQTFRLTLNPTGRDRKLGNLSSTSLIRSLAVWFTCLRTLVPWLAFWRFGSLPSLVHWCACTCVNRVRRYGTA